MPRTPNNQASELNEQVMSRKGPTFTIFDKHPRVVDILYSLSALYQAAEASPLMRQLAMQGA
jgi:hypothetical protein